MSCTSKTDYAVAPAEFLIEWVEEKNVGVSVLQSELGLSTTEFEDFVSGRLRIDFDLAAALFELTGVPFRTWLSLDDQYVSDCERLNISYSQGVS